MHIRLHRAKRIHLFLHYKLGLEFLCKHMDHMVRHILWVLQQHPPEQNLKYIIHNRLAYEIFLCPLSNYEKVEFDQSIEFSACFAIN